MIEMEHKSNQFSPALACLASLRVYLYPLVAADSMCQSSLFHSSIAAIPIPIAIALLANKGETKIHKSLNNAWTYMLIAASVCIRSIEIKKEHLEMLKEREQ